MEGVRPLWRILWLNEARGRGSKEERVANQNGMWASRDSDKRNYSADKYLIKQQPVVIKFSLITSPANTSSSLRAYLNSFFYSPHQHPIRPSLMQADGNEHL